MEHKILSDKEITSLVSRYYKCDNGYIYIEKIEIDGVYVDGYGIYVSEQGFEYNYHIDFGLWDYIYDDHKYDMPQSLRHYYVRERYIEVNKETVADFIDNVFDKLKTDMHVGNH